MLPSSFFFFFFPISTFLLFCFSSSPFFCYSQIPHLAKTQKMELFIPSMACMSAALGSNSQRDRLTAVVACFLYTCVFCAGHSLTCQQTANNTLVATSQCHKSPHTHTQNQISVTFFYAFKCDFNGTSKQSDNLAPLRISRALLKENYTVINRESSIS